MTEFIINSEQLERMIEAIEHDTSREVNRVIIDGERVPEIVRCRDCKHATISTLGFCKYCEMFVLPDEDGYGCDSQVNLPLDFFCAWGERRDA